MEYVNVSGNRSKVMEELTKYIDPSDVEVFLQNLSAFQDILGEDEAFRVEDSDASKSYYSWTTPDMSYYINLRKTTIAFLGLLLDLKYADGIASFVLPILGLGADSIRKLEDCENVDFKRYFIELYQVEIFDEKNQLTEEAYANFIGYNVAAMEHLYTNIFVENQSKYIFSYDVKALYWFLYTYR